MTTKPHPLTGSTLPVHFRDPGCFPLFERLERLFADPRLPAKIAQQIREQFRALERFDGVAYGWFVIKSVGVTLADIDQRISDLEQAAHKARFEGRVH